MEKLVVTIVMMIAIVVDAMINLAVYLRTSAWEPATVVAMQSGVLPHLRQPHLQHLKTKNVNPGMVLMQLRHVDMLAMIIATVESVTPMPVACHLRPA